MAGRPLTGYFPPEIVRQTEFARLEPEVLTGYTLLSDLTGNVSDAMDELGLESGVPRLTFWPNRWARAGTGDPAGLRHGSGIAGQVVTLRNLPNESDDPRRPALPGHRLGDIECYNLAERGDVLVVEGVDGVSSMGGISAAIGQRVGLAGAIVAGSVRDVAQDGSDGLPIWSTSWTPASGKYRLRSVEIMGPVTIGGVVVRPGDLVVADETGVCFVPYQEITSVLERAQAISARETTRKFWIEDELPGRFNPNQ
jgi:regulator of RNase E activity RraA